LTEPTTTEPTTESRSAREASEARFARLYADFGRDVLAYALPRSAGSEDAADIVAETFLVAWRRIEDAPDGGEGRLWLYGIARRTLANQQRGERRRTRLSGRLRAELAVALEASSQPSSRGAALIRVLGRLRPGDREILMLAGWEELKSPQIARVLGISAAAARTRLHRARRRLRRELAAEGEADGLVPNTDFRFEEG
jgi:RNA polymerase sigma factor (sigma-70 family)